MALATMPSDEDIREMAEARVGFKRHAMAYLVINIGLAAFWFVSTGGESTYWPVWTHLGWGIGLAFHAWGVYGNGDAAVAREEARLREKLGRAP